MQDLMDSKRRHTGSFGGLSQTSYIASWDQRPLGPKSVEGREILIDAAQRSEVYPVDGGTVIALLADAYGTTNNFHSHKNVISVVVFSEPIEKELAWLKDYVGLEDDQINVSKLRNFFNELNELLIREDTYHVERLFEHLSRLNLCLKIRAGAVRYAAPAKDKIKNWKKALTALNDDLLSAGKNAKGILVGLNGSQD